MTLTSAFFFVRKTSAVISFSPIYFRIPCSNKHKRNLSVLSVELDISTQRITLKNDIKFYDTKRYKIYTVTKFTNNFRKISQQPLPQAPLSTLAAQPSAAVYDKQLTSRNSFLIKRELFIPNAFLKGSKMLH